MPVTEDQLPSQFSTNVDALMRCIGCCAPLAQRNDGYSCLNCGRDFPSVRGVPRFVDAHNYADSFGFQWQRYARTQLDDARARESELDFGRKTGFTPEQLRGKLVLDVGCGMGRFADVATRLGARVVGIDLSAAAEVAARNLAGREFRAYHYLRRPVLLLLPRVHGNRDRYHASANVGDTGFAVCYLVACGS